MFTKIITLIKSGIAWGREVATGNDGMGSASRVVVLFVTTVTMGVLIAHVCMNHGLPSADQMYGLSALLASGAGAYATNKIRRDSKGDQYNNQQPPPPQGGQ